MLFFPFWFNNLCKFCSKNLNRFDLFPSDEEWFDRVKIFVRVSLIVFMSPFSSTLHKQNATSWRHIKIMRRFLECDIFPVWTAWLMSNKIYHQIEYKSHKPPTHSSFLCAFYDFFLSFWRFMISVRWITQKIQPV